MKPKFSKKFNQLLKRAKTDENIIGLFFVGSRGKGFENEHSDYDIMMIVNNEVAGTLKGEFPKNKFENIELIVMSLSEFMQYAEWGSAFVWDRYTFSHVKALVDKTGEVQKLIDEKGLIPGLKRYDFIVESLDGYINQVFRSVKCFCNKNILGARLEASASIPSLLDVLFALHNRLWPFYGYLEKELKAYSLEKLPWPADEFLKKILLILSTADIKIQQEILKAMEKLSRREGFGKVFDDWKGKDKWAMTYRLK